jgi:hypothetical protein
MPVLTGKLTGPDWLSFIPVAWQLPFSCESSLTESQVPVQEPVLSGRSVAVTVVSHWTRTCTPGPPPGPFATVTEKSKFEVFFGEQLVHIDSDSTREIKYVEPFCYRHPRRIYCFSIPFYVVPILL